MRQRQCHIYNNKEVGLLSSQYFSEVISGIFAQLTRFFTATSEKVHVQESMSCIEHRYTPKLGLPAPCGEGLVHAAVLGGVGAPRAEALGLVDLGGLWRGAVVGHVCLFPDLAVRRLVPVLFHQAPVWHLVRHHLPRAKQ